MKKFIIFLVLFGSFFHLSAQNFQEQMAPQGQSQVTRIALKLNFPDTIPLVVQTAVFSRDPFKIYDSIIESNKSLIRERMAQAPNENAANMEAANLMTFLWNSIFQQVSGFEMLAVTSRPKDQAVISAPEMSGRFWVTTKVTFFNKFFVCWCLPIQVESGQGYSVEMNAENTLNLRGLFTYILNKDSQGQTPPKPPQGN